MVLGQPPEGKQTEHNLRVEMVEREVMSSTRSYLRDVPPLVEVGRLK